MDKQNVKPVVRRILQIYDVMDAVKDRSDYIKDTRKREYYQFLNIWNYKKIKLEQNLEMLKKATSNTFDESVDRLEKTLNEINLFIKRYKQIFQ